MLRRLLSELKVKAFSECGREAPWGPAEPSPVRMKVKWAMDSFREDTEMGGGEMVGSRSC